MISIKRKPMLNMRKKENVKLEQAIEAKELEPITSHKQESLTIEST